MSIARFKDSVGWQKAMKLVTEIYAATQRFPKEEMFGLTNQLRRASVSIASNIAEGQGRLTTGEFVHFLGMARGSALEVQTQLAAAKMLHFGEETALNSAEDTAIEVVRILNAAIATNQARIAARKTKKAPNDLKYQPLSTPYSLLLTPYSFRTPGTFLAPRPSNL